MITAVRACSAIGALPLAEREIRCRSPPLASTRKPIIAVQKPAETHENSTVNRPSVIISRVSLPLYGSTVDMKYVAIMVCTITRNSSTQRRCAPAGCHLPSASGPSCSVSHVSGTGGLPSSLRTPLRTKAATRCGGHGRGTIDARFGSGPVATWTVPSARRSISGSPPTFGSP